MEQILVVLGFTTALRFYLCARVSKKKRTVTDGGVVKEAVGHVATINLFPVKSARGIHLEEGQFTPTGVTTMDKKLHDRELAVCIQTQDFAQAQSRRQLPKLALISSRRQGGNLILEAPGMQPLSIPLDIKLDKESGFNKIKIKISSYANEDPPVAGIDCGNAAARWMERFFGKADTRLALISPDVNLRPASRGTDRGTVESYNLRCQDAAPFMFVSQASLDDLNTRLHQQVPMGQFRPNIEIAGCDPYAEDSWQTLYIGDAVFEKVQKCFRCMLVTVSETTGTKNLQLEPFETLKSYRHLEKWHGTMRPIFGVWFRLVKPGVVHKGDTVWLGKTNV